MYVSLPIRLPSWTFRPGRSPPTQAAPSLSWFVRVFICLVNANICLLHRYVEGGVYADIDVEAIRPIKKFIPKKFDEADVDMVIGIEVDEPSFSFHPGELLFKATRIRASSTSIWSLTVSSSARIEGKILLPMDLYVQA